MLKKKFDYNNGEDRVCKDCGVTYHTHKPRWRCLDCLCAQQKKYPKPYIKKEQYPFDNQGTEASNRFCKIRTRLSNAWKTGDRKVINAHYDRQLKEIQENGIMAWILDRRDVDSKKHRVVKTRNRIRKEFPDTRGHYEY